MMKRWGNYNEKTLSDLSLNGNGFGFSLGGSDESFYIGELADSEPNGLGIYYVGGGTSCALIGENTGDLDNGRYVFLSQDKGEVTVSIKLADRNADGLSPEIILEVSKGLLHYSTIKSDFNDVGNVFHISLDDKRFSAEYNDGDDSVKSEAEGKIESLNAAEFDFSKMIKLKNLNFHFEGRKELPSVSFEEGQAYALNEIKALDEKNYDLGLIEWSNGSGYVVGQRKNKRVVGWSLTKYYAQNCFEVFFTDEKHNRLLSITFMPDGHVYIKNKFNDSYEITYFNNVLTYAKSDTKHNYTGVGLLVENYEVMKVYDFDKKEVIRDKKINFLNKEIKKDKPGEIVFQKEKTNNTIVNENKSNDDDGDFNGLIGMENFKKEVKRIKAYLSKNNAASAYINMCFLGNPGTGKFKAAKELAQILFEYKAIENNNVISFSAKEVASPYFGDGVAKLADKLKDNLGGVIYIKDADALATLNGAGIPEALNYIIDLMENNSNTCFIFSGDKELLEDLVNNNSRLNDLIRFKIHFENFNRDALKAIILAKLKEDKYSIDEDALSLFLDAVEHSRYAPGFANARTAKTAVDKLIVVQNVRTENEKNDYQISKADVINYINGEGIVLIGNKELGSSDAFEDLNRLIGLSEIKESVTDLISFFSINKNKKADFHMSFYGNPGTGKTEVARILGKLLYQEGVLPTDKFVECTRNDLVGQYIGQTAPKTRAMISKAMGGVLFIDEAYALAQGGEKDFGPEAIAELLKQMEDHRGEFCVILAGYTNEMKELFRINPGFLSRVKFNFNFPDYSNDELKGIAKIFLKKDDYQISDENLDLLVNVVSLKRSAMHFANARSLRESISQVEMKQAGRVRKVDPQSRELTAQDILNTFGQKDVDKANRLKLNQKEEKATMIGIDELISEYKKYEDKPFDEVSQRIIESVIAIKASGEAGAGESSGFIISSKGYAVTCAHCVRGMNDFNARIRINHRGRDIDIDYKFEVVAVDETADVAVIKLLNKEKETFEFVPLAPINVADLPYLSKVYLVGYPFGVSRFDRVSINEGKIASYQRNKGEGKPDAINLDISAKSGNSGSCIVDGNTGRVIGVLCGSELSHSGSLTEEVNYCRPVSYVWDLIKENYIDEQADLIDFYFHE